MSADKRPVMNRQKKLDKKEMVADIAVMQSKILDFINSGKRSDMMIQDYRQACQFMLENRLRAPLSITTGGDQPHASREVIHGILSQKIADLKHLPGAKGVSRIGVARYVGELMPLLEYSEYTVSKRNDGKDKNLLLFLKALDLPLDSQLAKDWVPPYLNTVEWLRVLNTPLHEQNHRIYPSSAEFAKWELRSHEHGLRYVGDLLPSKNLERIYYVGHQDIVEAGGWALMRVDGWQRPTTKWEENAEYMKRIERLRKLVQESKEQHEAMVQGIAAGELQYEVLTAFGSIDGRIYHCLRCRGIRTLLDLVRTTKANLLDGNDHLSIEEVGVLEQGLGAYSLKLGMSPHEIEALPKREAHWKN